MEISRNTHDSMAPMTAMFDAIEVMSPPRADAGRPTVRGLLTSALGRVLTPEMAAAIELASVNMLPVGHRVAKAIGSLRLPPDDVASKLLEQPQAEAPVYHRFGPGIYIRELHMKAGTLAVGRRQKFRHVNILLRGKVEMFQPDGSSRVLEAPLFFIGEPGQKFGYVIEDTVWQNIYATEETDICKLEDIFMESGLLAMSEEDRLARERTGREVDRQDFLSALAEIGVTPEQVRQQSEIELDLIDFPEGQWDVRLAPSPIEGVGLYATRPFHAGELICPARVGDKRTPAGRYVNHAADPNCEFVIFGGRINLVARRRIVGAIGGQPGEELTVCYRQARNAAAQAEGMVFV